MKWILTLTILAILLIACSAGSPTSQPQPTPDLVLTTTPPVNLANPASAYCEQQGNTLQIRTNPDGSQFGVCIFPDGSECDEWEYYRGECGAANANSPTLAPTSNEPLAPTSIPTPLPIDPAGYQGWQTYTHALYNFTIMLPEDWMVEELASGDGLMDGHILILRPKGDSKERIRMTFRRVGEEVLLWPTGVGEGEFIPQGTLDVAGQPAQRLLFVCPTGEITSIWYHQAEGQPNITRGDLEFGFLFTAGTNCEPGHSLGGKVQRVGEMIIASLKVPQ